MVRPKDVRRGSNRLVATSYEGALRQGGQSPSEAGSRKPPVVMVLTLSLVPLASGR